MTYRYGRTDCVAMGIIDEILEREERQQRLRRILNLTTEEMEQRQMAIRIELEKGRGDRFLGEGGTRPIEQPEIPEEL